MKVLIKKVEDFYYSNYVLESKDDLSEHFSNKYG